MAEEALNKPTVFVTIESTTCATCGIAFGLPDYFIRQKRRDATSFFCPNGHSLSWKESEEDRLRKSLAVATEQTDIQRARAQRLDRQLSASRGQVTKIKNCVANGVCPCCHRTFVNLQRHMGTKHPDFKAQELG